VGWKANPLPVTRGGEQGGGCRNGEVLVPPQWPTRGCSDGNGDPGEFVNCVTTSSVRAICSDGPAGTLPSSADADGREN
jgi:hypothetical protein